MLQHSSHLLSHPAWSPHISRMHETVQRSLPQWYAHSVQMSSEYSYINHIVINDNVYNTYTQYVRYETCDTLQCIL